MRPEHEPLLDDLRAQLLEPRDVGVEALVDERLELDRAARALAQEVVELAMPPDDAAGHEHRAARAVAFLVDDDARPARHGLRRSDETGHTGPGDDEVGHGSDQREAGLVLDVLDADAVGPAEEHRERVRCVDDVLDVEPARAGLLLDLPGAVHEEGQVVEERALALVRIPLAQLDVAVVDGEAGCPFTLETEVGEARGGGLRVGHRQHHVVEVGSCRRAVLDDGECEPLRCADDEGLSVALRGIAGLREPGARLLEARDPDDNPLEHASLTGPLGGEERHLATPRVPADQRERIGAIDHMHAAAVREQPRQLVAFCGPEGDVVERRDVHLVVVPVPALSPRRSAAR